MAEQSKPEEKPAQEGQKKPYHKPVLTVYGNIEEITKAVGSNSMPDGGISNGMDMSR